MQVCHVIHSLNAGGAESVLVDLARAAPGAGWEMSVISLMDLDGRAVNLAPLLAAGARVETAGLSSRWDLRGVRRADEIVRRLAPDVLHTHLKHADLVGAAVSRMRGIPLVSTLHVVEDSVGGLGTAKRTAARWARDRVAARTIAVSRAQRDWYVDALGGAAARTVVVHNGVHAHPEERGQVRASVREEFAVPASACLAVAAAVLRPAKGVHDLLAALAMVPEHVELLVLLAGDGEQRAELEALAARSPAVSRRLRFVGWRDDVPRLMAGADLAVHPSHADALPTVLIHALSAGVPAIATAVGGSAEVVADGAGVLLPPGDPAALARALTELGTDADLRRSAGKRARGRYDEHFRADVWAERLKRVYDDVARSGAGPAGSGREILGRVDRGDART